MTPKPKQKKSEGAVLTKIKKDMTDEEINKQIDAALDVLFGPEDDEEEEKEEEEKNKSIKRASGMKTKKANK